MKAYKIMDKKSCPKINAIKLKNIKNVTVRIVPSTEFLAHIKKRSLKVS